MATAPPPAPSGGSSVGTVEGGGATASGASAPVPPHKLFVRNKRELFTLVGAARELRREPDPYPYPGISTGPLEFSEDGQLVIIPLKDEIRIHDANTNALVRQIPCPANMFVHLSPLKTFLVTLENNKDQPNNLAVWNVHTGEEVARFPQRKCTSSSWPLIQWTSDESLCALLRINELQVFDDLRRPPRHVLHVDNASKFSIAPGTTGRVAIAAMAGGGAPVTVSMYQLASGTKITQMMRQKADNVSLQWHPQGEALLVTIHSDVDTTGMSYYGNAMLFFMTPSGDHRIVPTTKEGAIGDVQWSPSGNDFILIQGVMPAAITMFNKHCEPHFQLGVDHRNCVRWSPHGRFICVGGFGNLIGDMDFWDYNKKKKMGSVRASGTVSCEWSPCGRYFLTATVTPRLRVDNGYTLWTYRGEHVLTQPHEELYQVRWRPAPRGMYPDRPQSPAHRGAKAAPPPPAPPKRQAYVPPAARARGEVASFSFRDESSQVQAAKSLVERIERPKPVLPPGAYEDEVKKKKKKKKSKKGKAASSTATSTTPAKK
eukprot:gnl/Spiro4/5201_TR2618_c0_g1_i1.p1 gnl/Spiro4/5201_TR2618_c0_g1~~gnl/Spiro4/5201_TR2618_c0_g1_i1.p1  ORF type:complete len:556 (+),score=145.60 gnl/Spiro4/5201_TR2618_c0_g1_i1:42-1670(+)